MHLIHSAFSRFIRRTDILAFIACLLIFWFYPQIDLLTSALFYDPEEKFFMAGNSWVLLSYQLFARLQFLVLGALLLTIVAAQWSPAWRSRGQSRAAIYLLLLLLTGPGLLVNGALKENWGRARPREVMEFGGPQTFTPALIPAAQCNTNCSFVSGHAALGFYLIGMAWVKRRRRWLLAGIVLGALVGAGRIMQGGHFLGDIVFSFWVVYFTAELLAWLCRLPQKSPSLTASVTGLASQSPESLSK